MPENYSVKELRGLVTRYVDSFSRAVEAEKEPVDFAELGASEEVAYALSTLAQENRIKYRLLEKDRDNAINTMTEHAKDFMDDNYVETYGKTFDDYFLEMLEQGENLFGEDEAMVFTLFLDGNRLSPEALLSIGQRMVDEQEL